jgi:hypothetical protein
MRRLKIMSEDIDFPKDPFGVDDLQDRHKTFCREEELEAPRFWIFPPDGYYICHAVSLHLKGKDRWEEFDVNVIFVLKDFSTRDNREMEANRLRCMFDDLGEPIVLTSKMAESPSNQKRFYNNIGLIKMPVSWSDENQNVYEVYAKGHLGMGGFVNLMERVEYIGKEIVYKQGNGQ